MSTVTIPTSVEAYKVHVEFSDKYEVADGLTRELNDQAMRNRDDTLLR